MALALDFLVLRSCHRWALSGAVLLLAVDLVAQRRTPVYATRLVERFDGDNNGRLDDTERHVALAWIRAERAKDPPRTRRSSPPPEHDLEPRQVDEHTVEQYPDRGLYDSEVIQTIFLEFEAPDWDEQMKLFWRTGIQLPATLVIDGVYHRDVGVHYRGSSSFFTVMDRPKKSLGIAVDWAHDDQRVKGYRSLNLLSAHADPSFLRSVLFAHIAGRFVKAPKSCFVHLVINGESWGLYINEQQINRDFLREAFGETGAGRWKVRPNFSGEAALAYRGSDPDAYRSVYELRSAPSKKAAWRGLIELCAALSIDFPDLLEQELPKVLDVDHTLWFLALDNVLMDGDGYHYRGSDYALFMDGRGRFHPLFRDNNEAFSYGGGPGGFGRERDGRREPSLELDPLARADEPRAALCRALLSVPAWRARYLEHCRALVDEWLDWEKVGALIDSWREQIEPFVQQDDKSLYGYDAFVAALDQGDERRPGLKRFFAERRAFLAAHPLLQKEESEGETDGDADAAAAGGR